MNKLADLEERISSLPEGYVTRKVINNKPYYYHQWKSNGKNLSRTLNEEEVEPLKAQIEERKKLEKELKLVRKMTPDISEFEDQFNCNITVGDINISGNADEKTVGELRRARKELITDILNEFKKMKK